MNFGDDDEGDANILIENLILFHLDSWSIKVSNLHLRRSPRSFRFEGTVRL